jgi:hypothetical protein
VFEGCLVISYSFWFDSALSLRLWGEDITPVSSKKNTGEATSTKQANEDEDADPDADAEGEDEELAGEAEPGL